MPTIPRPEDGPSLYVPKLSQGPTEVRNSIAEYIKSDFPYWLGIARRDWNLKPAELPGMKRVYLYDTNALQQDDGPSCIIHVNRLTNQGQDQVDDYGADQYSNMYNVRLFCWCKGRTEQKTLEFRDNFSTALQWCLLARKTFNNDNILLNVDSMTIEYGDAAPLKGDKWVATSTHSFDMGLDETIVLEPYGVAEEIDLATEILGPGEAAPEGA